MHTATISGKSVEFEDYKVGAMLLRKELMAAAGVEPEQGVADYLPKQNKSGGVVGCHNYVFDLRECSDFVLHVVNQSSVTAYDVSMSGVDYRYRDERSIEEQVADFERTNALYASAPFSFTEKELNILIHGIQWANAGHSKYPPGDTSLINRLKAARDKLRKSRMAGKH